jgi:hypothetical protein
MPILFAGPVRAREQYPLCDDNSDPLTSHP